MPKVGAFSISGLELVFHSDDHAPPHFHATRPGEWSVRVFILELKIVVVFEKKRVTRKFRKELRDAVVKHREELLGEWEEKVQKGS